MNRRELVALLGAFGLGWYRPARAQQAMPVIGFLHSGAPGPNANRPAGFRKGLREAGFEEGKNVAIEFRWAEGRNERLAELAADLVRRRVNVITTLSATQASLAAKSATTTVPIVFQVGSDPVAIGLVASLNKPGGDATGISSLSAEIISKRVGLLSSWCPRSPTFSCWQIQPTLTRRQWQLNFRAFRAASVCRDRCSTLDDEELRATFNLMSQKSDSALVIGNDPAFYIRRSLLATLAANQRLPAISYERDFAFDGGLMSYGPKSSRAWEMAGSYVARILHGEKPADLPVIQSLPSSSSLT